jgi:hypothetical protein
MFFLLHLHFDRRLTLLLGGIGGVRVPLDVRYVLCCEVVFLLTLNFLSHGGLHRPTPSEGSRPLDELS